jgi:hypothetical protein
VQCSKELTVSGALDPPEELLSDDLVGIDVGPVEQCGGGGEDVDRLH